MKRHQYMGKHWHAHLSPDGFDDWFNLSFGPGSFTLIVWRFGVWRTS